MKQYKLGFIGSGNMAYAIARGIITGKVLDYSEMLLCDKNSERLGFLNNQGFNTTDDILQVAENCQNIMICVYPQNFGEVLELIKPILEKDQVIISIAAGITSKFIKERTSSDTKVVLVMPNTPLSIGYSSTALANIEPTTKEEFAFVTSLFNAAGHTNELPESLMKEVIPVNSSACAFVYRWALSVVNKAEEIGLDREEAKQLFAHAMIGSAKMIAETDHSLEDLIEMVCTPGGATIQGVKSLEQSGLDSMISDCFDKTIKKAYELGK